MKATDWDAYYARPFSAATVTRRITTAKLLAHLQHWLPTPRPSIVELGGANSCFITALHKQLQPSQYVAVDNNRHGLTLLTERCQDLPGLSVLEDDVQNPQQQAAADLVFSVGLIEHFDAAGTAKAIATHYRYARPGGLVLISFPTPTWLYRTVRSLAELTGNWRFPDERPLTFAEVASTMQMHGELLAQDLNWAIMLTQGLLIGRKSQ
jgi:SAM-dependent methyltransferase